MGPDKASKEELVSYYSGKVDSLLPYVRWLDEHEDKAVAQVFDGEGLKDNSITFPVYDSTLLGFVRACNATGLMNRNYAYTYTHYSLRTAEDEKRFIAGAALQQMGAIADILSKYILRGAVKGPVWSEGVRNGVMKLCLLRMKELIDFWSTDSRDGRWS